MSSDTSSAGPPSPPPPKPLQQNTSDDSLKMVPTNNRSIYLHPFPDDIIDDIQILPTAVGGIPIVTRFRGRHHKTGEISTTNDGAIADRRSTVQNHTIDVPDQPAAQAQHVPLSIFSTKKTPLLNAPGNRSIRKRPASLHKRGASGESQDLNASQAGMEHSRSPPLTHLTMREMDNYQMGLVVREVNQRLVDDSNFFSNNAPQVLPSFQSHEIELGDELGRGDFGIVYSVSKVNPDFCDCPQCILKEHYRIIIEPDGDNGKNSDNSSNLVHDSNRGGDGSLPKSGKSAKPKVPPGWMDEFTNRFGETIVEDADEEDDDDYKGDTDDDDDSDMDGAGVSTLSSSSLIRVGDGGGKRSETHPTIRASLNIYTRCYMQRRGIREGRPRYAVKRLRDDFEEKRSKYNAAIDLSVEAKFLASLKHPNIIRARGTVEKPGHDDFMIMMDCLNLTLREKMQDDWNPLLQAAKLPVWRNRRSSSSAEASAIHRSRGSNDNSSHSQNSKKWFQKLICNFNPPNYETDPVLKESYVEKLMAMYDLARGLKFLHHKSILFRDLKPENIGFDVRGRVKIFDFGLAKELKLRDLIDPPDAYDATGLTGSRRYMAPEVVLCKYYGFASDVFSFGILFWEVFSGKVAFDDMNFNEHFEQIVIKGKRPNAKLPGMRKSLIKLMGSMWEPEPRRRPDFKNICQILRNESKQLRHDHHESGHHHHLTDRTAYLMGQSARSQSNDSGQES